MRLLGSLLFFIAGAVVGAVIGAVVASMLAPQSGEEFKSHVRKRIEESRAARDRAEAEMAETMTQKFRSKVGDPDALTNSSS